MNEGHFVTIGWHMLTVDTWAFKKKNACETCSKLSGLALSEKQSFRKNTLVRGLNPFKKHWNVILLSRDKLKPPISSHLLNFIILYHLSIYLPSGMQTRTLKIEKMYARTMLVVFLTFLPEILLWMSMLAEYCSKKPVWVSMLVDLWHVSN